MNEYDVECKYYILLEMFCSVLFKMRVLSMSKHVLSVNVKQSKRRERMRVIVPNHLLKIL